jgi:orotidine-5'-phosphate decarboxylase
VHAGWRAATAGQPDGGPIIVSSSRAVLYAGGQADSMDDFAQAARRVALATQAQLQQARPAP